MREHPVVFVFSPLVVTESSTQRRRLISVEYATETIHPVGDLPEHSTRQGLVRFASMLSEYLALRYALRLESLDHNQFDPISLS